MQVLSVITPHTVVWVL